MAKQLFDVSRGLSLNEAIWMLAGGTNPGADDSALAPVGSTYSNTGDGSYWVKHTPGAGLDKWAQQAMISNPNILNNVTTEVVLDQVLADSTNMQKWIVTACGAADQTDRITFEVVATHNGTDSADATIADHNEYGLLEIGDDLGVTVSVGISGTGANQTMQLKVAATTAANITSYRVATGQMPGGGVPLDITTVPHDIAVTHYGAPSDNAVVMFFAPTRSFSIAANFTNSVAVADTAATAEAVFTIFKLSGGSETQIGTITFAAASKTGVFSTSSETLLSVGDVVKIKAPATADSTLADLAITIQAYYL